MRSTLVAILLSLTLLLPTTIARSPDVQASCAADIIKIIFTIGLSGIGDCSSSFGASTDSGCLIGDVGATAKIDANGLSHGYDYRLAGDCGDIHVQAGYAFKGGEAAERLEGKGRTVKASWYCSNDPWIFTTGQPPSCSRIAISVEGSNADAYALTASEATYPLSAGLLAYISRETLDGQVQNAENRAKAAASKPASAPEPAPKPVTPPKVSPFVVLDVASNDGPYVEAVQYLLRHHGADVEVDGNFGEQTEAAVRTFQAQKPMTVNGAVGLSTWEALWVTVGIGAKSDAVSAVQTLLNAHGFDVDVDGDFRDQTWAQVVAFQEQKQLFAGGIVDEVTWRALIAPPKRP